MRLNIGLARGPIAAFLILLIGCSALGHSLWNQRYGEPTPREVSTDTDPTHFQSEIKPLLEQRCVVCHGCFDAPCQLKLESREGLFRGAHKDRVYDGTRLLGAELTRLFEDADTTAEWREKDFFPVINEREQSGEANLKGSVLAQMLMLKQEHPQPRDAILSDSFDFSLNQDWHCPRIDEFDDYAQENPLLGMPYALPELAGEEHDKLIRWLEAGARAGAPAALSEELEQQVDQWEAFFNRDSNKAQLVNRYLYEHLFQANLYFAEAHDVFFKLVRSSTPPGEPIARISTARPFDDPKTDRVYYRLWRDPSSVVVKNHLPYRLDGERRERWQQWFFESDYEVSRLPSYEPDTAANPFATFEALPVEARYRFLLDEAEFTIMNFIKGPVCRGQIALNVIQDHFWVTFVDPEFSARETDAQFLAQNSENLHLPAEVGNTLRPLSSWLRYSEQQKDHLAAKARHLSEVMGEQSALNLERIWDGDGDNSNAALTIFRHTDSASVHRGLIGHAPKTSWVIDYPLLERIHYLLVAGFDVYGNSSHQLLSRLYMDFLRMEGEMNFVSFLPEASQKPTLERWYQNAEEDLQEYLSLYQENLLVSTGIEYQSDNPKTELYDKLKDRLAPVLNEHHSIDQLTLDAPARKSLDRLSRQSGKFLNYLPPTTVVYIPEDELFTLVQHNAYSNLSSLFKEEERRLPEEDTLTATSGIIGSYPHSFMLVSKDKVEAFADEIQALGTEEDYQDLRDRYGVRRSDPNFWAISDAIHKLYFEREGVRAGLLDYNRLENR